MTTYYIGDKYECYSIKQLKKYLVKILPDNDNEIFVDKIVRDNKGNCNITGYHCCINNGNVVITLISSIKNGGN